MIWVVVTLAVITTLAAAAAPYLYQLTDVRDVNQTAATLGALATGIDSFDVTVKRGPTKYTTPHFLNMLTTTAPVAGDSAGCTITKQPYNSATANAWPTGAPYVDFYVPVGGLWTPLGLVVDVPSRTAASLSSLRTDDNDSLFIQIDEVDVRLARMLDLKVDGTLDGTADTVRFDTPGSDSLTMVSYWVPLPHNPSC